MNRLRDEIFARSRFTGDQHGSSAHGDPLDLVCMVTEPTFPGCLIEVRPVGIFLMEDEKGVDEKVLVVPIRDPLYAEYRELEDVPKHFLREMDGT